MKAFFTVLVSLFSLCHLVLAQTLADSIKLEEINPYNLEGYFVYDSTTYQYTVSPENDKWSSLVIRRKQKEQRSDAVTFKEVYVSQIVIKDKIKVEGKHTAHIQIRYARKEGYAWKPSFTDFLQVVFLFDEGKIRYAPFGEKMIDRKVHSVVSKDAIKTRFDTSNYTLADAVKTSIEFFIMKFPSLFAK